VRTTEARRSLVGRAAAFGARNAARLAFWRARREARATDARPMEPVFRGFIQINLIRPR
jgi:hypothetical protein